MSEKLCTLRKSGGGKMKETVLWTNPNTTVGFASSNINLSDNISKYKFISIKAQVNTNISNALDYYFDTTDVVNATPSSTYPKIYIGYYTNSTFFYRVGYYQDDTHLSIADCLYNRSNTTAATGNNAVIPVSISGWK